MVQAPVGRIFFTGEHTSERFSGYVHGAYLAGEELIFFSLKFVVPKQVIGNCNSNDFKISHLHTNSFHSWINA